MKNKQPNYKLKYSDEEHALAMFDENAEYFDFAKNEFDILPYCDSYYSENKICFRENDGLEKTMFISCLKEKKYIEETTKAYNIVRITEKGKKRIFEIKERKQKFPYI